MLWEKQTGQKFLVHGLSFESYIRKQRDDYNSEKENEKLCRVSTCVWLYSIRDLRPIERERGGQGGVYNIFVFFNLSDLI